jgi:hypothetical protein
VPVRSPAALRLDYEILLASAGRQDAVTLINLLWRVPPERRGAVFDKLASFYPPPAGVTRDRAVAGDWLIVNDWWTAIFGLAKKLPPVFMERG